MKSYKKATMVAKNASCGAYAAGCPTYGGVNYNECYNCQRVK